MNGVEPSTRPSSTKTSGKSPTMASPLINMRATAELQIAPFIRYSQTRFTTDPDQGDVILNGFADASRLPSLASGVQADGSEQLGSKHTLRFGVFFQNEHTTSKVASTVLPSNDCGADPTCIVTATSNMPFAITDQGQKTGQLYGIYLQDEWKLTPKLTLQLWRAVRHGARAHQGIAAKPARQSRLDCDAAHDGPHRLLAELHATAARADCAGRHRAVQQYDKAVAGPRLAIRSRQSASTILTGASSSASKADLSSRSTLITKSSATCSTRASSARRLCSHRSTTRRAMPGALNSAETTRTGRSTFMPTSRAV